MIRFLQFCFVVLVWATMSVAWSQTMINETERVVLDTTSGDLTVDPNWYCDSQVNLRISTRWLGAESGTLRVNGVEVATLAAMEERDFLLTIPANSCGVYVCDFQSGGTVYQRTIRTTGVRKVVSSVSVTLDTRPSPRLAADEEHISYSTRWCGADSGNSETVISVNGAEVSRETGSGTYTWTPTRNGTYEFTHTTYAGEEALETLHATFIVEGKDIPFPDDGSVAVTGFNGVYDGAGKSPTLTAAGIEGIAARWRIGNADWSETVPAFTNAGSWTVACEISAPGYITQTNSATITIAPRAVTLTSESATGPYNGRVLTAHAVTVGGDGFVLGEGATYAYTGSQTVVGSSANTFTYTLNDNTRAENYTITTAEGARTVTKAGMGGGDGGDDEPGSGEVPEGGLSKFDTLFVYDGTGHTVDAEAITAAFAEKLGTEPFAVTYAADGGDETPPTTWQAEPLVYTHAGAYVVWYRVASANYEDFVHAVKLTITPRAVTLTSKSATKTYDGTELMAHAVTVGGDGFAPGEGANYTYTGSQTVVGSSANTFTYTLNGNTRAENYTITTAEGARTVTKAGMGGGTGGDDEPGSGTMPEGGLSKFDVSFVYDGEGHTVNVEAIAAAFTEKLGTEPFAVTYAADGGDMTPPAAWTAEPPVYTNAGEYIVWYRVASANYEDFVHAVKLTITPRAVTLTSESATKTYDGTALTAHNVTVCGGGFVLGEGATYAYTGSQTIVGSSANTFTYTLNDNTRAENYTITTATGTLTVTPAALDPSDVFGGEGTEENPLVCERVYDGTAQGLFLAPDFGEAYRILYALAPGGAYSETSPTRTNVTDGDLKVYFRFVSPNYSPFDGVAVLRIVPKAVTEEMLAYSDDAFFYDGANTKVPDVILADTNALGVVISTSADYTRAYGARRETGEYPVTITGWNNYAGTVTKLFKNIKRPVAPPVIPAMAYNGRTRRPSIPSDARWTVVANPGGVDAGLYTNVVLRLTNAADYRWKGLDEDAADWTGVFEIRRAGNGWSRLPDMGSWTNGVDAACTPTLGQPRYGGTESVVVTYRVRGAEPATGVAAVPTVPGKYTARFSVAGTVNYAETHYDVDFEIFVGPGDLKNDHTVTTPVPVLYVWLDPYLAAFGGDYEAAAHATGRNGHPLWESYVAGLDPTDATSQLRALIAIDAEGEPVVT